MGIIANIYCRVRKKPVTSAVKRGWLSPPRRKGGGGGGPPKGEGGGGGRGGGGGGENSREMWRDATWENELMRHQPCDSTVAVCVFCRCMAAK